MYKQYKLKKIRSRSRPHIVPVSVTLKNAIVIRVLTNGFWFCQKISSVHNCLYHMSKDHMNQFIFKDMTDNTKLCKNARDRNRASFSGWVILKNAVVSRVLIDGFWFCLRFLFDHNCFYHMSKGHIDQWILGDMTGNTKLPKSFSGRDRASFTVSIVLKMQS